MNSAKDRLIEILRERSVKLGSFTLASGARSPFYIDARRTTMSGEGLKLIGELGLEAIDGAGWKAEAVGGMTLGADPVSYAIARASRDSGSGLDAFTVRKHPKDHGTGRRTEGCLERGSRVVLIEDVVTTGGSALEAAEFVEAEEARVVGVLTVVDRDEGGREAIQRAGYEFVSLVTLHDLGLR